MAEKYGDIDWISLSGDDGIVPTQALHRAFMAVAKRTGVKADVLLFEILGEAETGGTDYMRNFRAGKIAKFKAEMIHVWLAQSHFDTAQAVAPELFPYRPKSAFQEFIYREAITGKLKVVKLKQTMGLIERADDKREHVETLRLSERFCFEVEAAITGVALAFQYYQGQWHLLPLGADQRRMKADVAAGISLLPSSANGKPIALQENDDAGNHQFAMIVSEDSKLPQDMATLSEALQHDNVFEIHIVAARFVT